MRGSEDLIASENLFGKRAGEERFPITIEIGRPFKWGGISPTEWACTISVDPLLKRMEIHGEGSFQALCLALRHIRWQLEHFKDEGGIFLWENNEEWCLQNYWSDNPWRYGQDRK